MTVDRMAVYDEVYGDVDPGVLAREDGWPQPEPLGRSVGVPAFPVEVLPSWLRDFVEAESVATQTPVDLCGVLTLTALAAAAGGRAVVEARPGWREPLNLFCAVAMPPGTRKTPVFQRVTSPLGSAERGLIEATESAVVDAATQRKIADRRADEAENKAARADEAERDELARAASEARAMAEAITVPTRPRLLADDATPEALTSLLAEQAGRIAVLSDEGDLFDIMAGRYSRTSSPPLGVFLKGHAGSPLRVDRKGRAPEHIEAPALTLGLAVQPDVLRAIADRPGFRGRGLLARFLWCLPASNVGNRTIGAPAVPDDIGKTYDDEMTVLVASLAEWVDPAVIPLTDEANTVLLDFEAHLEPRLGPSGDLAHIADWGSKLAGHTVRLAGLLHLAANIRTGWSQALAADTMRAACRLADYFVGHALAVFDLMGSDPVLHSARIVAEWAKHRREFTRREAHRDHQSLFARVTDLDPVLDLLCDTNVIRPKPSIRPEGTTGRPPSPIFTVNPRIQ